MAEENVGGEAIGRRGKNLDELRRERSESRQSQTYKDFLGELRRVGSWDEAKAEKAAVSVLCLLEQRIVRDEAKDLNSQLPRKLQGLLHRCERHEEIGKPRDLDREMFVRLVGEDLSVDGPEAEVAIRNVFQTIRARVTEGEVDQVIHQLPAELREFWQPVS